MLTHEALPNCSERKNVNLPGVVVDLPTLTAKDEDDLVNWGLPNDIDFIAASFVRKGSDLDYIRKVLRCAHGYMRAARVGLAREQEAGGATRVRRQPLLSVRLSVCQAPPAPWFCVCRCALPGGMFCLSVCLSMFRPASEGAMPGSSVCRLVGRSVGLVVCLAG
jgi:Pyruvate kinase, barrel domain